MICPNCQALSPDDSYYCFNCGTALSGEGSTFAFSHEAGIPHSPHREGALAQVKSMSWLWILLFQFLTLGLYGPAWFISRARAFNSLYSTSKLTPWMLWLQALCQVASLAIQLLDSFAGNVHAAIYVPTRSAVPADALAGLQGLFGFTIMVISIHQSLRLRRILKDHALNATGKPLSMGWLWTILFRELHLQRSINRLKDRI